MYWASIEGYLPFEFASYFESTDETSKVESVDEFLRDGMPSFTDAVGSEKIQMVDQESMDMIQNLGKLMKSGVPVPETDVIIK